MRHLELSFRTRAKNLDTLSRESFDLVVIGGGITGAGVAREAVLRGLSVAVIERRDFAAGTSSRSSKLIHGGLRYLAQGDVALVREAATERHVLRRLAPHLARPRQLVVPVSGRGGYAKIKAGLWTFDRLAQVVKEEQYRMVSKAEALELEPALRPDRLYAAGVYYECLTDDARLVIEVIKSAAALGAVVVNHAEVVDFLREGGRLSGVVAREESSGADIPVRGRVIINAAGPWVDVVRLRGDAREKPCLHLTKGVHLGLPRERLDLSRIVIMTARDHRSVFAIPHGTITYLGTTDTDYPRLDDYPRISLEDVEYLLEAANRTFVVDTPLSAGDVVSTWSGLRPLLHEEGKKPSEISRKDEIMVGPSGMLSIAGGKLTTFRRMAERIVDQACEVLQQLGRALPARVGNSAEAVLSGGETGDDLGAYAARLKARWPRVGADIVERLVDLYGSNAERLVEAMGADPVLAERCAPGSPLTRGEVEYALREEMALTLEDFLERRARLMLWDRDDGLPVAPRVAAIMAAALGWDAQRVEEECQHYREQVLYLKTFHHEEHEAEPQQAARA